jgi:hypothetical protein
MNTRTLFTALIFTTTTPAIAADQENGSELHAESCIRCHDSSVYTRDNRRVQSLSKLGTQVRFCKDNLAVPWFDDEVDDVIHYLNSQYYKF